jgi:hypothetical protein
MSWSDLAGGVSGVEYSAVESRRFGVGMARLTVGSEWASTHRSADELYASVRELLAEAPERIVIVRFPSELVRMATAAVPPSRTAIPAGTLMYWGIEIADWVPLPLPPGLTAAPVEDGVDPAGLLAAIADSFAGYANHYSSNPELDASLVAAGYREWAEATVADRSGRAYQLSSGDGIVGVATVRGDLSVDEIELAGVVTSSQGRGLYRHLLDGVLAGAKASGRERVVISTQSHNLRVQRAWASAGLRPIASIETLHAVTR